MKMLLEIIFMTTMLNISKSYNCCRSRNSSGKNNYYCYNNNDKHNRETCVYIYIYMRMYSPLA